MEITQQYLKECLDYNEITGIFTWKVRPIHHFENRHRMNRANSEFSNKSCGFIRKDGYVAIKINNKAYKAHRLAWLHVYGVMPENQVDHVNGIKADNRIFNLREATNSQNCENQKKAKSNNIVGLLGVSKAYGKRNGFISRIQANGKQKNLGYFPTAEQAHEAYILAKRQLHGHNTL